MYRETRGNWAKNPVTKYYHCKIFESKFITGSLHNFRPSYIHPVLWKRFGDLERRENEGSRTCQISVMSSYFEERIYIRELSGPCSNLYMKLAPYLEMNIDDLPGINFNQKQCKDFEKILRSSLQHGFDEFASHMDHGQLRTQKAGLVTNLGNMFMLYHKYL